MVILCVLSVSLLPTPHIKRSVHHFSFCWPWVKIDYTPERNSTLTVGLFPQGVLVKHFFLKGLLVQKKMLTEDCNYTENPIIAFNFALEVESSLNAGKVVGEITFSHPPGMSVDTYSISCG